MMAANELSPQLVTSLGLLIKKAVADILKDSNSSVTLCLTEVSNSGSSTLSLNGSDASSKLLLSLLMIAVLPSQNI